MLRKLTTAAVLALLCSVPAAPAPAQEALTGEWTVNLLRDDGSDRVQVNFIRDENGMTGLPMHLRRLQGLTPAQLAADRAPVRFRVESDAGSIDCVGELRSGRGSGEFTFAPSAAFAAQLAQRGLERPALREQFSLAMLGVGLADVDETLRGLAAAGSPRPATSELVRVFTHGIGVGYLRELASVGYRGLTVAQIIRLHNHQVTARYVADIRALGYTSLSPDEVIWLHNHAVDADFIRRANARNRERLSLAELVWLQKHDRR